MGLSTLLRYHRGKDENFTRVLRVQIKGDVFIALIKEYTRKLLLRSNMLSKGISAYEQRM